MKHWIVPLDVARASDDDHVRARIEFDREHDLIVWFERGEGDDDGDHIAVFALTPLQACQLGQVLLEASREAGQAKAGRR